MSDQLPAPLTPFGCDMSGNDWFPLHFRRLRESRWWRSASHLARSINIDLWGRAYEQVPAGSLPDDDIDLADWAGFGRDVQGWAKVKAEVMAPWLMCDDGRWYHPTLCEMVLEAWERLGEKRRKERERKAAQRAGRNAPRNAPSLVSDAASQWDNPHGPMGQPPSSHGTTPSVPRDHPPPDTPCPAKNGPYNTEQTLGTSYLVASRPDEQVERPGLALVNPSVAGAVAMAADVEFAELWSIATPDMRRRAKSREVVFKAWAKARKDQLPSLIVAALRRYVTEDADVKRGMGQPGLQRWLADKAYDQWIGATEADAAVSDETWRMMVEFYREGTPWAAHMGPEPGRPGCRAPAFILAECGFSGSSAKDSITNADAAMFGGRAGEAA